MQYNTIRQAFLDFFVRSGHTQVPSSALVPHGDPTLLFTNAGMVQFKDVFLGKTHCSYDTATTVQKCLRAGGKHNDLENVGHTRRHHTFFEMLGNFSFGAYGKEQAICYAWDLITKDFAISPERFWITVYKDDHESYDIWKKVISLPSDRIIRIGDQDGVRGLSDNFWQMADVGPCGPCTEIFYDHGPSVSGSLPGTSHADGDRYMEIWNIVFMEYDRDEQNHLSKLPRACVDTGMGLERIATVLQNVVSNYETDFFVQLIETVRHSTHCLGTEPMHISSVQVIADHIRAAVFLIAEDIAPSNDGRGYVLRRILRRAVRYGHKLGCREPFLYQISDRVIQLMSAAYPDLPHRKDTIKAVVLAEEEKFFQAIEHGLLLFRKMIENRQAISGEVAFTLYDTHGFPIEMTESLCKEHNVSLDKKRFMECMDQQRKQSQRSHAFKNREQDSYQDDQVSFTGYDALHIRKTSISSLYNSRRERVALLATGEEGLVVVAQTPFYPESGGQVGDTGYFSDDDHIFIVQDTQKVKKDVIVHAGYVQKGPVRVNDITNGFVDQERRESISRHHSATHLLHKALKKMVGDLANQKGSHVNEHRLRFDFSCPSPLTKSLIKKIELFVNSEILTNQDTQCVQMDYASAVANGAVALFDQKYATNEMVRVVSIGSSLELCGGTHVSSTGAIGLFKITTECSVAAGVRRIEAVAGMQVYNMLCNRELDFERLSQWLQCKSEDVVEKVATLYKKGKDMQDELVLCRQAQWQKMAIDLLATAQLVPSFPHNQTLYVSHIFSALPRSEDIWGILDELKKKVASVIAIVAASIDQKHYICVMVSRDICNILSARSILKHICQLTGAQGGGKEDRAQAGGGELALLPGFLTDFLQWVSTEVGTDQAVQ